MLDIKPKQFKLTDDGTILFQVDATNPLPGQPVGRVIKGDSLMRPAAVLTGDAVTQDAVQGWLNAHIDEVLLPLAALKDAEEIPAPARAIADKIHDAFGILPRADLEGDIAALDEEGRRALRARKVRLGPILVFLPALNKPAAVRLRALLWTLWQERPLPASVPADGVTSMMVEGQDVDPVYFRAIGYPVYGPRAIRVDMLDRLITAVYDHAKDGVFKAQHAMAEWLGCPIPDLYAVLEAMDHKKIYDPADEKVDEEAQSSGDEAVSPEPDAPEAPAAEPLEAAAQGDLFGAPAESAAVPAAEDAGAGDAEKKPAPQVKQDLATFKLRRGKAYGKPPRPAFRKKEDVPERKSGGKPAHKRDDGQKPRSGKPHRRDDKKPRREQGERVISAAAPKPAAASPFDVLKGLKVQNKE